MSTFFWFEISFEYSVVFVQPPELFCTDLNFMICFVEKFQTSWRSKQEEYVCKRFFFVHAAKPKARLLFLLYCFSIICIWEYLLWGKFQTIPKKKRLLIKKNMFVKRLFCTCSLAGGSPDICFVLFYNELYLEISFKGYLSNILKKKTLLKKKNIFVKIVFVPFLK